MLDQTPSNAIIHFLHKREVFKVEIANLLAELFKNLNIDPPQARRPFLSRC
jgi:hypothetical protein